MRPVVPVRAQDDLGVHGDARPGQALHARHQVALDARLPEQPVPQLGVGRVDRDEQGREPLLLDPVELALVEVGQRDVVPVQERQAEVVVLDVEALAHAARQLMDEAEHALVGAGGDLAGPRRLELDAEVGSAAVEGGLERAAGALDGEAQARLAPVKVEVDHISEWGAVDGQDAVARAEAGARRGRPRAHGRHDHPLRARRTPAHRPLPPGILNPNPARWSQSPPGRGRRRGARMGSTAVRMRNATLTPALSREERRSRPESGLETPGAGSMEARA